MLGRSGDWGGVGVWEIDGQSDRGFGQVVSGEGPGGGFKRAVILLRMVLWSSQPSPRPVASVGVDVVA